jgi:hypothetical protein
VAGLLFAVPWTADAAPTPASTPTHFVYRDAPRELELDVSRLAIRLTRELAPDERLALFGDAGVAALSDHPAGGPGWYLVDLARPLDDTADAARRMATLGALPDVAYTAPVYFGDHGWVVMTAEIFMRVVPAARGRAGQIALELLPGAEIIDPELGGLAGALSLRATGLTDGFAVLAAANRMAADPRIAWAEPAMQFEAFRDYIPNDPLFGQLWGIRNTGQSGGVVDMDMDGDEAWDLTTGDPAVAVLMMDDGVDVSHPDLNLLPGDDFTSDPGGSNGAHVNICDSHGTLVAGCICAVIDNDLQVVGISPHSPVRSARTYISTVPCDGTGTGNTGWLVNALEWGFEQGCRVSNLSWTTQTSSALEDTYIALHDAGMAHFKSAGNNGQNSIPFPGTLDEVHAVGSVTRFGTRSGFSNYGDGLSFVAPGDDITTTSRGGGTSTIDGTSFSAPYAAGVAALVFSMVPVMTTDDLDQRLYDTCVDLGSTGYDIQFGHGFINARAAVDISIYYALAAQLIGPHTRIGSASEVVSFAGEIENIGITDDTYDISLSGVPAGWTYSYTTPAGTFSGPSALPLVAGDLAAVSIDVDSQGQGGTATMTLTATSQADPSRSASFSFTKLNGAQVLVVDDDGGGTREVTVGETLDALGLVWGTHDLQWGPLDLADLTDAAACVIWLTGDTSLSLDADDRALIGAYHDAGGKLLLSGQEIGFDLFDTQSPWFTPETITWFITYLHCTYTTTYSTTLFVDGEAGDPIGDGLSFSLQPTGPNSQTTPDVVLPGTGASSVVHYQDIPNWKGGIRWENGSTQLLYLCFGIEGIIQEIQREEFLDRILTWFGIETTGLAGAAGAPPAIALAQSWPNPMRPSTTISYRLDAAGPVTLRVYDVAGRLVRTLVERETRAASTLHRVAWNGRDESGRVVPSGVYFYRLETPRESVARRLVVVR